jgi:hypothetical protein
MVSKDKISHLHLSNTARDINCSVLARRLITIITVRERTSKQAIMPTQDRKIVQRIASTRSQSISFHDFANYVISTTYRKIKGNTMPVSTCHATEPLTSMEESNHDPYAANVAPPVITKFPSHGTSSPSFLREVEDYMRMLARSIFIWKGRRKKLSLT